jgi:hypothetical protein
MLFVFAMAVIFKIFDIERRKREFALRIAINQAEYHSKVRGWPPVTQKRAYFGPDGHTYVVIHDLERYETIMRVESIWSTTVISRVPQATNQ